MGEVAYPEQIKTARKYGFYLRVAFLTVISALLIFPLHMPLPWLEARIATTFHVTPGEASYIVFVLTAFLMGVVMLAVVGAVIKLEKPKKILEFFKLGPVDWTSLGLIVGIMIILDALELLFLRGMVYEPIRQYLISLGLWGAPSLSIGFVPDTHLWPVNVLLLLAIIWIEAPEEIFFRGYVQNYLQERIGPIGAMLAGALIWDLWHIFNPAEFFRRLLFALAYGGVFMLRQNTTALAIWHPVGNRLLVLASMLPM